MKLPANGCSGPIESIVLALFLIPNFPNFSPSCSIDKVQFNPTKDITSLGGHFLCAPWMPMVGRQKQGDWHMLVYWSTYRVHQMPMLPSYEPENTFPPAAASTRTASSWPSHFLTHLKRSRSQKHTVVSYDPEIRCCSPTANASTASVCPSSTYIKFHLTS